MKTALAIGLAFALTGAMAYAQVPATGDVSGTLAYNQVTVIGPHYRAPTPLLTMGNVQFEIWSPVSPPYDAAANRNLGGNPLW